MHDDTIRALYDQDQRIDVVFGGFRREVGSDTVRHVSENPENEGFVTFSKLDEATADAAIKREIAYFAALGQDFEWKYYSYDSPVDLRDRLVAAGFELDEPEAIMVLDLERTPAVLSPPNPAGLRRITDPTGVDDVMRVERQVWGDEFSGLDAFLRRAVVDTPDEISVYVVYEGARSVSAAWVYFQPDSQFASLWGGSTLAEYRGRGFYTGLLAARAREAQGRNLRYLTVDASPMSRPILEKHGFELICYSIPCKWRHNRA